MVGTSPLIGCGGGEDSAGAATTEAATADRAAALSVRTLELADATTLTAAPTAVAAMQFTLSTAASPSRQSTRSLARTPLPFCLGYVFKRGDIPAGQTVTTEQATLQVTAKNRWPDGSLKFAQLAGHAILNSAEPLVVLLSKTPTAPAAGPLTTSDLGNTGVTAQINCGAFGTAAWSAADWNAPFSTWVEGAIMSSWIYRKPIGADAHLVAWLEVRLFAGGAVEVLPWVENGYLTVAGPTNKSATYQFTLGGTRRFSAAVDVKHRTRVPLLASTLSHWLGTDPGVTPKHDTAYLQGTGMVPTYGPYTPTGGDLDALPQTYTANTLGGISSGMGSAGTSGSLIPDRQAMYITSGGDARAYRAALVFGFSGGSWSTHYRDEATNNPIRFSQRPNVSLNVQNTPVVPAGTGGENGTAVTTHQPSFGYLPALISGWFWFFEESAFWMTWNYMQSRVNSRRGESSYETAPYLNATGAAGVIDPRNGSYTVRGAAWSLRALAQTLTLCADDHPMQPDLIAAWEANTLFYQSTFLLGTHAPGWVSPQGFLGEYSSSGSSLYTPTVPGAPSFWYGAAWMAGFGVQTWGFTSDLGLPQSEASLTRHLAVRNHAYKQVVGRADDGLSGRYNWRRFAVYSYPVGIDSTGLPVETWCTAAESHQELVRGFGLSAVSADAGLTLLNHSADTDIAPGGSTANDYLPFAVGALAYAVTHNATGAAAGWARVSGASNFATALAGLRTRPGHGLVPRATPLPAWRTALAPWQWVELASADLSTVSPTAVPGGGIGARTSRIDAWNGITAVGGKVCMAGVGGHADWAGNEGYECDLLAESPTWTMLNQPSANADIRVDVTHYADGRPTSSHTYYALHADPVRNKIFRVGVGSAWGSGNFQARTVDSFNLTTNDWDAATWPSVPESLSIALAQCQNPVTGDIYACGVTRLWRFNLAAGTWTQLALIPNSGSATYYRSSLVDPVRNRVIVLGNAYATPAGILVYDIAAGIWSTATLTGAQASTVAAQTGDVAYYDAQLDKYLMFPGGSTVIEIDPVTLGTSLRGTSGGGAMLDSINGVFQKIVYVSELKGYAYQVRGASKLWFLASE
jgi:hypothetical protein